MTSSDRSLLNPALQQVATAFDVERQVLTPELSQSLEEKEKIAAGLLLCLSMIVGQTIAVAAAREPEVSSGVERDKTDGKPFDTSSPPDRANQPAETPAEFDPNILKIIAISIAIIGGIFWYLWYRNQAQQQLANLHPIERIYRSTIVSPSKTSTAKLPAQTQLEYARSIKNTEHPQIAKIVAEISQLYTAWRYGNQKIDVDRLAKKLQNLQHLQQLAANRKRQQWIANQKALWMPGHSPKN